MPTFLILATVIALQEVPPPPERLIRKIGTSRFSHSEPIASAALSPDGRTLAIGEMKLLKIWDFESGQLVRQIQNVGRCLAWSDDGKRLAAAGGITVQVFDTTTWELVVTLTGHAKPALALAFSPDGRKLASASDDVTARVWDVDKGKELIRIDDHLNTVFGVAISPDERLLATASRDGTVRLWSMEEGKPIRTLKGHTGDVCALSFSRDGGSVVSAGGEDTGGDCSVRVWEPSTGELKKSLSGHAKAIRAMAWSKDGSTLATGSCDGEIRTWEWPKGAPKRTIRAGVPVRSLSFTPDGGRIVAGINAQVPMVFDAATGDEVGGHEGHRAAVTTMELFDGGTKLAAGDLAGEILIWDVKTWKVLRRMSCHSEPVNRLAVSRDGRRIATTGRDRFLTIRNLEDGAETARIPIDDFWVQVVAWWPDENTIAINGNRKELQLYDASSGKRLKSLLEARYFSDAAFLAGGKEVAIVDGQYVKVRSVETGESRLKLKSMLGLQYVTVDPSGRWLLGTYSGFVIHDLQSGKTSEMPQARQGPARPVFSPDRRFIAGSMRNRGFQVVELASGELLLELTFNSAWHACCVLLPDGKTLVGTSEDTTLALWNIAPAPAADVNGVDALWKELLQGRAPIEPLIARGGETVAYLKDKFQPKTDAAAIAMLLSDLDSADEKVLVDAFGGIESLGGEAEGSVEAAATAEKEPGRKEKLTQALESLRAPVVKSPASLRRIRAMEVLERIGSKDAIELLKSLATTAVSQRERQEAAWIVKRLSAAAAARSK